MGALARRWPQILTGCCVAVAIAAACSSGDEEVVAPSTTMTPTTVPVPVTAAPTTTTTPPPSGVSVWTESPAPAAVEQLEAAIGAAAAPTADACHPETALLVLPATAELPPNCERFDRSASVAVTSQIAVWGTQPTACLSLDDLQTIVEERPFELVRLSPDGVDPFAQWLATRGLSAPPTDAAEAAPAPEALAEAGTRFLVASTDDVDLDSDWHVVLIDGGQGCAAPAPAEVLAGRYPFGEIWELVPAADASAQVVEAIASIRPEIEAAQAPPPAVDVRYERPGWLGTPLTELRPGTNYGVAQPTPPELVDRQLATVDVFPSPRTDEYRFTIGLVPPEVVPRSTWSPACPVALEDLRYLTMTFWGFDQRPHTGEMIVNESIAELTVEVFRQLYELRFPIEDMTVMPSEFWTNPPTGDDNITSSFECRRAVGGSGGWSNHALGLAIDINPFHNVYRKGTLILPEYAEAYLDRDDVRPGMIVEGDEVVAIFDALGWGWGGRWSSADDPMHFSVNGR